jgi:hypothetical protein
MAERDCVRQCAAANRRRCGAWSGVGSTAGRQRCSDAVWRNPPLSTGWLRSAKSPTPRSSMAGLSEPLTLSAASSVTDRSLRNFNLAGCILHSVQGLAMLVASQAVPSIKAFKKMLTTSFLEFDAETQALVPRTRNAFNVEIGLLAAVFVLLSAVAHLLVLIFWDKYLADIKRETNRARWYEYSISSSIMICGIAVLFGCYDLGSLILMFFINAVMNMCGLLMERMNPPERTEVDWSPFVIGCVAGVAPWIVVVQYFVGGGNFDQIPGFVYGILVGYFICEWG